MWAAPDTTQAQPKPLVYFQAAWPRSSNQPAHMHGLIPTIASVLHFAKKKQPYTRASKGRHNDNTTTVPTPRHTVQHSRRRHCGTHQAPPLAPALCCGAPELPMPTTKKPLLVLRFQVGVCDTPTCQDTTHTHSLTPLSGPSSHSCQVSWSPTCGLLPRAPQTGPHCQQQTP